MKYYLTSLLAFIGRLLLRMAMDSTLRNEIEKAIYLSEHSNLSGEAKMKHALYQIKMSGAEALLHETESTLRTKVEQMLDDLVT